jgi:gamma-glutamyltranspeptidase/glutathione hydrolase
VEAYRDGGNAIDAALAAAAMLTVVYPHQCSLGGDVFALVDNAREPTCSVNGSGAAPGGVSAAALRSRYAEIPDSGPDSITVPGAVAAWGSIHERGAQLPFARLLKPAAEAAAEGVPVTPSLERGIRFRSAALRADEAMCSRFLPQGEPLKVGALLRQPELAATFERLARQGPADFYSGGIARELTAGLRRLGCPLTLEDLKEHRTEVCEPLRISHAGGEILSSPPNSPGFTLLETIAALDAVMIPIDPLGENADYLLSALMLAIEDRDRYLGDPRRSPAPLLRLLSTESLAPRLRERYANRSVDRDALRESTGHGDTVAVCAIDSRGTAVSLIQSVFQTFGAALMEPATGVILHNRARGFSLSTGAPNEWAPRERPAHTLTPLLMRRAGRIAAALGTMGGRAQPQILAQLLPGSSDLTRPLAEVVRAPRWVVGARDIGFDQATVAIEADAPGHLDRRLSLGGMRCVRIPRLDERAGHAQVVRVAGDGALEAASDPRSDGAAQVVSL